jgi:VWFA-related protein
MSRMARGRTPLSILVRCLCVLLGFDAKVRTQFRTGVDIVPVYVSVLDAHNRPVKDLTAADFVVSENGIRQEIKTFASTGLDQEPGAADHPANGANGMPAQSVETPAGQSAGGRRFLLLFGFGSIDLPTHVFDGVRDFIKKHLTDRDHVGILAWNRIVEPTTDHETVLQIVDRYRQQRQEIDRDILKALVADTGTDLPAAIQERIDTVLTRRATGAGGSGAKARLLNAAELLVGTKEFAAETKHGNDAPWNFWVAGNGPSFGKDNDLQYPRPLYLDRQLPKILAGIEYLRRFDGDKHLIAFMNGPNVVFADAKRRQVLAGFAGPSVQDDEDFARRSAAARVAVDVIYTGGVAGYRGAPPTTSTFTQGSDPVGTQGAQSAETVAQLTGGQFLGNREASESLDRINQTTQFGYLIGYSPASRTFDGTFRSIRVDVRRPGVTVAYRHGYYASENTTAFERDRLTTVVRQARAQGLVDETNGLHFSAQAEVVEASAGFEIRIGLKLTVADITFTQDGDGRRSGSVEVTIQCGDDRQSLVGALHKTYSIGLGSRGYDEAASSGLPLEVLVPVTTRPKYVKATVYDPRGDMVGSQVLIIK